MKKLLKAPEGSAQQGFHLVSFGQDENLVISNTTIILNNQKEPHLKIDFINYPKFPLSEEIFKDEVLFIGKELMKQFEQNRILIIYTDETVMLEQSNEIDPRIRSE